jgi:hypothetical protein
LENLNGIAILILKRGMMHQTEVETQNISQRADMLAVNGRKYLRETHIASICSCFLPIEFDWVNAIIS